jgi:hypothetical protein
MRPLSTLGIILVVLGAAALVLQGVTYTSRQQWLDIGPISVTTERTRQIPLPPLVAGTLVATGIALLIAGARRRD